MISFNSHVEALIKASNEFEDELYTWATKTSKTPNQAIDKIKRVMAEKWPDGYAGNRDSVIKISLLRKEAEDVIWRIEKEALGRPWDTNSETTKKS